MTTAETDALVRRANSAGFSSVAEYAASLERAGAAVLSSRRGNFQRFVAALDRLDDLLCRARRERAA